MRCSRGRQTKVALELWNFKAQHYYLQIFLNAKVTRKLEGYIIRRMLEC